MKTIDEKIEEVVSQFDFDKLFQFINSKANSDRLWLKGKSTEQLKECARNAIKFSFEKDCLDCISDGFWVSRGYHHDVETICLNFIFGEVSSMFKIEQEVRNESKR